jgi:hypothetical protein
MITYHLQLQTIDGAWFDVVKATRYRAYTYPRPVEACAEALRLAPVRVVETTDTVVATFQPEEARL